MIDEKTEVPNGRLAAGLINKRSAFGSTSAPGYRCSNLVELLDSRRNASAWQLRNIEASMARQARDLARLSNEPKLERNIKKLSLSRLREVMDYDPATGALTWRIRLSPNCKLGEPAGAISKKTGYRKIRLDGVYYTASHLAWFHFYGVPPMGLIDHKSTDKTDDRIENLREATYTQNSQNIGPRANNSAGLKGASRYDRPYNKAKWRSTITVNKKRIFLGLFHTAEEAHEAYCEAAKKYHGEFARTH